MTTSCNGMPIFAGTITLPENGRWYAKVSISAEEISEGSSAVLTTDEGTPWLIGTVLRGKLVEDRFDALLVGGAGKLDETVPAQGYRSTSAQIVASSICSAVGETLAPSPLLASTILSSWTRAEGPAMRALDALALELGVPWRVNALGLVEFSPVTYAAADDETAVELDRSEARGLLTLSVEEPRLLPGTTIRGVSARTIVHDLGANTTEVHYRGPERARETFAKLVARALPRLDYLARYEARVVAQSPADDTLELSPVDERIPGLSGVPLRVPAPGMRVLLSPGARVLLGWDGADPSKPFAESFVSGTTLLLDLVGNEMNLGDESTTAFTIQALALALQATALSVSASTVALEGGSVTIGNQTTATHVALAEKVDAHFAALKTAVRDWVPVANDGGAAGRDALLSALDEMTSVAATDTRAS